MATPQPGLGVPERDDLPLAPLPDPLPNVDPPGPITPAEPPEVTPDASIHA